MHKTMEWFLDMVSFEIFSCDVILAVAFWLNNKWFKMSVIKL